MSFETDLKEFTTEAMQRHSVPGVAVGIVSPEGRFSAGLGVTALDTRFAVRPDTLFQVGSVSKPFTATLLAILSESGRVDLEAPVKRYVPQLRLGSQEATDKITTRLLLTHQAGFWGDWFDDFGLGDDAIDRFVSAYGRLPQMFEPGSMWAYNNCGYILAGLVAARACDTTYEAALKTRVLDPLGLDHTVLSAAEAIAFPVAVGHTNLTDERRPRIARRFLRPRARNPAGGVLSSIDDVLTFAELHLGKHPDLLSLASIETLHEPQAETFESDAHWGLGFKVEQRDGGIVVGHGGATNGFRAELALVPAAGFALAVLTNSDSGGQLADEVVNWNLERHVGIRQIDHATVELPAELGERYQGIYAQPYGSIEILAAPGKLQGRQTTFSPYSENSDPQTGEWFSLRHIGDGRFLIQSGALEGAQMKFWESADGTIQYLQAGGRLYVPGSWDNLKGLKA